MNNDELFEYTADDAATMFYDFAGYSDNPGPFTVNGEQFPENERTAVIAAQLLAIASQLERIANALEAQVRQ